jgi:phosphate transport system substrate-binding protein
LAALAGPVGRLNEQFTRVHPETKFHFVPGNDLSSFYSLIYDSTALAIVGEEFPGSPATSYKLIVGSAPFGIKIAHASLDPAARVSPVAVIVHPSNPLAVLSQSQVARIFTTGGRSPDLTHWSQLGLTGKWAPQTIHPTGLPPSDHFPSEDISFGDLMFLHGFQADATSTYTALEKYDDVVSAVAADPAAIGLTALNRVTPAVKVLGIARPWSTPVHGTPAEIAAGRYPYDRYLYLYVRRTAGEPLAPWVMAYLQFVLSPAGQRALSGGAEGYLPLNDREVAEELFKLQ